MTQTREKAIEDIDTVIAAHFMLSIRVDLLQYMANQLPLDAIDSIPVYKKVHKVVRCFRPKAAAKDIQLALTGPSFKKTRGPAVFELIVYSVIENAIKYSPAAEVVDVIVRDMPNEVVIAIRSIGPRISKGEQFRIFEKGYRSRDARQTSQAGTGIGLSTSKMLLNEYFEGTISVSQEEIGRSISGVNYHVTEFEIVVPTNR